MQDYTSRYKKAINRNPTITIKSKEEIIFRADDLYLRFHLSGGKLCVFGDYGIGIYGMTQFTWEKLEGFANTPFEYFLEKCGASTYGKFWQVGEIVTDEDGDIIFENTHHYAMGQYLALQKLAFIYKRDFGKKLIEEWLVKNREIISNRLYLALRDLPQRSFQTNKGYYEEVKYIEDMTERNFLTLRNVGKQRWEELALVLENQKSKK